MKCLRSDSAGELHEAVERSLGESLGAPLGAPVWEKRYRGGSRGDRLERAHREAELLQRVAGPGVLELLEVDDDGEDPILVLKAAPGMPLAARISQGPLSPAAIVAIGTALARTVARLQAARIVNLALSPDAIWVGSAEPEARDTLEEAPEVALAVHLVEFGSARALGEIEDGASGPLRTSALRYHSPEQTGRMGIGVDSRSDLYSLGACLYHAATGAPPFDLDDPLGLVHAHIARRPARPIELRPDLPPTLSRIISKLLQKSPEDRYQTAAALERDLVECGEQLARHGSIDDELILGTADAPYRPLFSKNLYGREREVDVLEQACASACAGQGNAVFLQGAPGIGKSALVRTLRKPLATAGGYLAEGKFDLYRRDAPYSGIADALDGVLHQLLTEDDERLAVWRETLERALGAIAGALLELVPDLSLIVPDIAAVERLPPRQTLARLSLAVQRLLEAIASESHPLVLFLDDLQWADAASRELLHDLLVRPAPPYLLFVGAYRENEVERDHPLARLEQAIHAGPTPTRTVALRPLGNDACAEMLADALGRSRRDVLALAEQIGQKTARNPLLIQQYVSHLYDLGLIHVEAGVGWVWDEAQIREAAIADGAIQLLNARIALLPAPVQRTLELAACVGDEFDLATLCSLTDQAKPEVESGLFTLCDEGLVAPSRGGFRFVHDRVREAAQEVISEERRAELHHAAASLLLRSTPPEALRARAFEIADHLNLGARLVPEDERHHLVEINRLAGERASGAGASSTAYRYFATALAHASSAEDSADAGASHHELRLKAAEAALQIPDFEAARRWLDELRTFDLPRMLDARTTATRMQMFSMMGISENDFVPLAEVIEALARFGVRWPERPGRLRMWLDVLYTDWLLRAVLDERPVSPPDPAEPASGTSRPRRDTFRPISSDPSEWLPGVLVLGGAAPMLQARAARNVCRLSAFVLRQYLRHGYAQSPGLSLAGYAAFRRAAVGHLRGVERMADVALAWADRVHDPVLTLRTHHLAHGFVYGWTRARREAVEGLGRAVERMGEVGDVQYQLFSGSLRCTYMGLSGYPLGTVEAELRATAVRTAREPIETFVALADLCRAVAGETLPSAELVEGLTDQIIDQFDTFPSTRMGCWVFWLALLCVLGRYDLARRICDASGDWVFEVGAASSHLADYVLFRGLTASVHATDRAADHAVGRGSARAHRRTMRRSTRQLRRWAKYGPDFRHMARILEAECERVRGRTAVALRHYADAADLAEAARYPHHLGLVCERAASLLLFTNRSVDVRPWLERGARALEEWGAVGRARQLLTLRTTGSAGFQPPLRDSL